MHRREKSRCLFLLTLQQAKRQLLSESLHLRFHQTWLWIRNKGCSFSPKLFLSDSSLLLSLSCLHTTQHLPSFVVSFLPKLLMRHNVSDIWSSLYSLCLVKLTLHCSHCSMTQKLHWNLQSSYFIRLDPLMPFILGVTVGMPLLWPWGTIRRWFTPPHWR